MASSDSDDDSIISTILLTGNILSQRRRRKPKRRRLVWTHDWIQRREEHGAYHSLLRELRASDPVSYRNFIRMDEVSFSTLLQKLSPIITRQNTVMRRSISAEERLAVTLRYLATGII